MEDQEKTSQWLSYADQMRDARRWPDAVLGYKQVLMREPSLAPIWVQLGHALKESGQRHEAELAYRRSIALAPDVADTHLQIGHLLKLVGRYKEAIDAYREALRVDSEFRPALEELASLGVDKQPGTDTAIGQRLIQETLAAVADIRRGLSMIEAQLPRMASLASFAVERYDLFRRNFLVSHPPPFEVHPHAGLSVIILDGAATDISALMRLCHSLEHQTWPPKRVIFLALNEENAQCFDRIGSASNLCMDRAITAQSHSDQSQRLLQIVPQFSEDWLLLIPGNVTLDPEALAWFAFAITPAAAALYADEDHVSFHPDGHQQFDYPIFKTAFDPFLLEQGGSYGEVIAIRRAALQAVLKRAVMEQSEPSITMLIRDAAEYGPVGHIPRVLSRRLSRDRHTEIFSTGQNGAARISGPQGSQRIRIAIPTRNQRPLLEKCIKSLRATARDPNRLEFVVIDNGSDDSDTLDYLIEGQRNQTFSVVRENGPFNWSLLNNIAMQGTTAELLICCNNDIEMLAAGWDNLVQSALSLKGVGAVGAKLLYPDGTVQHAGIVFGPYGMAEHEALSQPAQAPGPQGRWIRRRRVGAVTGAFLGCRAETFGTLGGFDARELPIWFSDIDFCLRLRARGLHILFEPAIYATHHESKSVASVLNRDTNEQYWGEALAVMRRRWGRAMIEDPGFNPHFSRWDQPFSSITEPSLDAIITHITRSTDANPWKHHMGSR